jgi:hypothetical protein
MTNATRVAGVLEVETYVQGNISQEVIQDMFTRALATAVGVPIELIVSLTATEIQNSSGSQRRLQDDETNLTSSPGYEIKLYEVAYEIVVPGSMDANEVMQKADMIAEAGSAESQLFRQVLLSTNGIVGVGKIVSKVPAHTVVEVTTQAPTTEEDDGASWVSVLIGAVAFVLGVSCLVTTGILVKRRMASEEARKASSHQEFHNIPQCVV